MKLIKSLLAVAIAGLAATGAQAAPYNGGFFTGSGGTDNLISGLSGFDVFSNGATAFFCASADGCGVANTIAFGAQLNPISLTPLAGGDLIRSVYQGVVSKFNPGLSILGVVLTMYDRRNRLTDQVADDVRACLGPAVFETVIPRNVRLSEAPSHGLPALIYDHRCSGSEAYMALAREMITRLPDLRVAA